MRNGLVTMSQQEIDRLSVIHQLEMQKISQVRAAKLLGISTRQVRNIVKGYRAFGANALLSKRRGKASNNQLCPTVVTQALSLIKKHYYDFGPTLAHEKITEQHGLKLSVESVRQLMIKNGLWKGKTRKVVRGYQSRPRREAFGELVQIDGSEHAWFEGRGPRCCLIVFIDDATGKLVALQFVEQECLDGYLAAIKQHLNNYGKPVAYYPDKHGIFRVNIKEAVSGTGETQLSRALRELDIDLINANTPHFMREEYANHIKKLGSSLQQPNTSNSG